MEIITESIKGNLEIQLNKSIDDICEAELKEVKHLSVERMGFDSEVKAVDYSEISFFDNLEELTIFDCMVNTDLMNRIISLKKLKRLNMYNSDFIDFSDDFFDKLKIDEMVLSNCLGLKEIVLKGFKYLEIRNMEMSRGIRDIGVLDLVHINNDIYTGRLENVKKLMISETDYKKDKRIADFDSEIVVVDDRMNIVEEIKK